MPYSADDLAVAVHEIDEACQRNARLKDCIAELTRAGQATNKEQTLLLDRQSELIDALERKHLIETELATRKDVA